MVNHETSDRFHGGSGNLCPQSSVHSSKSSPPLKVMHQTCARVLFGMREFYNNKKHLSQNLMDMSGLIFINNQLKPAIKPATHTQAVPLHVIWAPPKFAAHCLLKPPLINKRQAGHMVHIYVLQLERGKFYVGKTNNPQFRLENHFSAAGSEWTRTYRPEKLLRLIPGCDDYDEDKYTMMYMDMYGVDNVRGGSFTSTKLDDSTKQHLRHMSNSANDKCFRCGQDGHFAASCSAQQDRSNRTSSEEDSEEDNVWCCDYCSKVFEEYGLCALHEKSCPAKRGKALPDGCFRCGRRGHWASSCYAVRHVQGYCLK